MGSLLLFFIRFKMLESKEIPISKDIWCLELFSSVDKILNDVNEFIFILYEQAELKIKANILTTHWKAECQYEKFFKQMIVKKKHKLMMTNQCVRRARFIYVKLKKRKSSYKLLKNKKKHQQTRRENQSIPMCAQTYTCNIGKHLFLGNYVFV